MVGSRDRLSRQDFLNTGLNVLAEDGPKSLSAIRMARELGVTTGSFYWHFQSVPRFHEALQKYWKDEVIPELPREAMKQARNDPARALEKLGQVILRKKAHRYDAAMRKWAANNADVARTVEAADEWRRATMIEFLRAAGATGEEARDRINLVGAAWRGSEEMDPAYRIKLGGLVTSKG